MVSTISHIFINMLFIVQYGLYYFRISQNFQKDSKIAKFCWFGHCTIQINRKVDINLLVFTKVTKSVESVIAMHQSTEIC